MLIKKVTKNYTESDHRATQVQVLIKLRYEIYQKLRVIDYSK